MGDVGSGRRCARAVSAAVTLLLAAAVVGCAGQQHKSIGRTYTSAGDYGRAVEAAKQSLAKSPDSSECIDLLSDAQTAAADFHFEQAKKLMEARQPASASAELELVLGYMPAHPGGNQLLVQVRAALAEASAKPQASPAVVASPAPVSAPRTETPTAPVQVVVAKPQAAAPGRIVNARTRMVERDRAAEKANGQVSAGRSSGEADRHLMLGIISRDDKRFKKIMAIMDGVTVKIDDADKKPLDVDLEIVAGKFKISPKDVPVGGSVKFQGISKRQYKLTVLWIDYEHESVKFAVDRVDEPASPGQ